jgi:tetratricopeptide (TPR) repeat protein
VNQRSAAEQVELSELTERAAGMLESASAAGDSKGIAEAVSLFDEVMSLCSQGPHVEYWKSVVNLADALIKQAEADGSDGPIDRALDLLDANEQHFRTPDQRVSFLRRKGQALLLKAQRTADRAVMRAAVQARKKRARLTPRGHAGYGEGMLELGITLLHSGAMFRNVAELDEAVAVLESAEKYPDGSADRSLVLTSLGNARLERLLRSAGRSRAELDVVVADHMEAMHERSPGGENSLVIESDYGSALFRAYEPTRNREYLDASLGPVRRAAEQTPAGHSRKSERLNSLVSVLLALFERDGDPATLDEAIRTGREAVAAASPGHAQYATCLFGLAYGLFRRGELRGTLLDFDEAAVLSGQVVEATPPGHTYRAMRLTLHAQALCYLPSVPKLEKAAADLAQAASLLRHDDPDRAVIESNHGAILEALASLPRTGEPVALAAEAVRLARKAADATRPEHSEYSNRLLNLTIASATLARFSGDVAVLDDPVTRCLAVRAPEPADVSSTLLAAGLAHALAVRYDLTEVPEDASAAIEAYQLAAGDARLAVFRRLHVAQAGAGLAARCDEIAVSLSLYALAVELLDSAAWRGMDRRDQERMLAGYAGIPSDAAAVAVTAGQPETAVEFLERGRGVLLDRHVDDSAELAQLREADPDLAHEFESLRHDLDSIVMPDLGADEFELPHRPPHQESEADQRSALARRLESLISEIRRRPECAGLFSPSGFARLQEAVGRRSAVIINISEYRCDAITVTSAGAAAVPLPSLSKQDAEDAAEFFRDTAENAVHPGWVGSTARNGITSRLAWLWDAVCEPVLEHLGITTEAPAGRSAPRVHWCPAGPAVFLPLHAAGRHGEPGPQAVIDRAESVYIARLRALSPAGSGEPAADEVTTPPLIMSMPETPGQQPLPGARDEAGYLMRAFPGAAHLTGPDATVEAVLAGMKAHSWFHFSAHGITDEHTPVNGGIELADGRLTIRDLLERRLPGARFAFLSACSTHHGSAAIPDETVTTAAALCIAGCGYVVATLWPVADDHAVDFGTRMYGELITSGNGTPALHPDDTPRVIREVCRAVRNTYPGRPERWVPFASAGSL